MRMRELKGVETGNKQTCESLKLNKSRTTKSNQKSFQKLYALNSVLNIVFYSFILSCFDHILRFHINENYAKCSYASARKKIFLS